MDEVTTVVTDGLTILGGAVSVYLAVGIGLAFLEAQMDAAVDRPSGRDIMQRIALLIACVALVAFARSVSDDVASLLGGDLADAGAVRAAVLQVGQYFLDIVIGSAALILAVGVAMGFVGAQWASLTGEAVHLGEVVGRVGLIVALGIGTFFTISIVNVVVAAMQH